MVPWPRDLAGKAGLTKIGIGALPLALRMTRLAPMTAASTQTNVKQM